MRKPIEVLFCGEIIEPLPGMGASPWVPAICYILVVHRGARARALPPCQASQLGTPFSSAKCDVDPLYEI